MRNNLFTYSRLSLIVDDVQDRAMQSFKRAHAERTEHQAFIADASEGFLRYQEAKEKAVSCSFADLGACDLRNPDYVF